MISDLKGGVARIILGKASSYSWPIGMEVMYKLKGGVVVVAVPTAWSFLFPFRILQMSVSLSSSNLSSLRPRLCSLIPTHPLIS
jgi:hypothetical protein